ncbi:MAG: hypothetical protein CME06_09180 [Gemmatimonadetes bacterium]|nr:hypothetical protein [Gemmatimonadota bacterium]
MSWEKRLIARHSPSDRIDAAIDMLFRKQRRDWQLLRENEATLAGARVRRLVDGPDSVIAQENPGRHGSVSAKVDTASVASRPCFLCEHNLPEQERAIGFGSDLFLLPNPYPIVPQHISIPSRAHEAQAIDGRLPDFLALSKAIGGEHLAIYNGPRCGASAPDHFHFQTGHIPHPPIETAIERGRSKGRWTAVDSLGRRAVVLRTPDADEAERKLRLAIKELATINDSDDEPMLNLLGRYRGDAYEVFFFPRDRHRPDCYFAESEERLLVSPGAMEMAGVVVLPHARDFERIDAGQVREIFDQVTLDKDRFEEWWGELR